MDADLKLSKQLIVLAFRYSRLSGGSYSSVVSGGANQLRLFVIFVDSISSLSCSVSVFLGQLSLTLHLLLTQLSIIAAMKEISY